MKLSPVTEKSLHTDLMCVSVWLPVLSSMHLSLCLLSSVSLIFPTSSFSRQFCLSTVHQYDASGVAGAANASGGFSKLKSIKGLWIVFALSSNGGMCWGHFLENFALPVLL